MTDKLFDFTGKTALSRYCGRGNPDEIVGAVLYLAGDASSFTTGMTMRVDGGAH